MISPGSRPSRGRSRSRAWLGGSGSFGTGLTGLSFVIWCSLSDTIIEYLTFASGRSNLLYDIRFWTLSFIISWIIIHMSASGR